MYSYEISRKQHVAHFGTELTSWQIDEEKWKQSSKFTSSYWVNEDSKDSKKQKLADQETDFITSQLKAEFSLKHFTPGLERNKLLLEESRVRPLVPQETAAEEKEF